MKFSIKNFFSKCDQIRSFLQIWSHILKKPSMGNFVYSAVVKSSFRRKAGMGGANQETFCYIYQTTLR